MNLSLRSPRVACGPLALVTALACALAFAPGRALASPSVVASPTSVSFGNAEYGTTQTQTVTLTNTTSNNLTLGGLFSDNQNFGISGSAECPSLPANGTCQVGVVFMPTNINSESVDPETGDITLDYYVNGMGSPQAVDISTSGTGLAPAAISVEQPSIAFGSWAVGQTDPATETLTVSNTGGEDLNIGQASLTGANADQFAIVPGLDGCSNTAVAASGSCTIEVQYDHTSRGTQSAELDIPSNDPNTPDTVELSGTGLLPATATPDRTSNDFGSVTVGQSSPQTTFTVTNDGDVSLSVKQVTLAGADADEFAITSDKCTTVAPPASQPATPPGIRGGGTCTVSVQFNPTAAGAQTAELDITPRNPQLPQTVIAISGIGEAVPAQSAAPQPPAQPAPQPKPLVERVTNFGRPASAQALLAHGEKVRVYCNQACSLDATLEVYYRAIARGAGHEETLQAGTASMQPWIRVVVGQTRVQLTHAGYETLVVKVAAAHHSVVTDAGSMLLGVYAHHGNTPVAKRWVQIKG
jgi:hypothetical protein